MLSSDLGVLMARLLIAALALPLLCLPQAGRGADLIPHHAFYTLHLGHSSGTGDVVAASGGMAIEVSETCGAWLTKQRLLLRIVRDEGDDMVTDNNFTSWETKDGLRYRFNVRNRLNGSVNEEYRGEARLKPNGGGGTARFTLPKKKDMTLPKGTLFPSAHVSYVIELRAPECAHHQSHRLRRCQRGWPGRDEYRDRRAGAAGEAAGPGCQARSAELADALGVFPRRQQVGAA